MTLSLSPYLLPPPCSLLDKHKNGLLKAHYDRLLKMGYTSDTIRDEMTHYCKYVYSLTCIPATNQINPSS